MSAALVLHGRTQAARTVPRDDCSCCDGRKNTLLCLRFSLRNALLCRRDKNNTFNNNCIFCTVLVNAAERPETAPESQRAVTSAPRGKGRPHPGCNRPGKGSAALRARGRHTSGGTHTSGRGLVARHGPGVVASARRDVFPCCPGHTLAALAGDKATP